MRRREQPAPAPAPRAAAPRPSPAQARAGRTDAAQLAARFAALRRPADAPAVQRKAAEVDAGPASAAPRNETGLPDRLKAGVEALSGLAMDDVKVHYASTEPARLQALAYTQGTDIHIAPGQERHLPHEAWHVVQQKQGRVPVTRQLKGAQLNDSAALEAEADRMGARSLAWTGGGAPATTQAAAPSAPVVQRRPPNPYSDATPISGASTAHHIVPDTLLSASLNRVAPGERKALQAKFLPAFGNLTLKQLLELGSENLTLQVGNDAVTRTYAAANAIATTKFSDLTDNQKGTITINAKSFAAFETDYGNFKNGAVTNAGTVLSADTKADFLKAFYEWQAGNIFLGASSENRLEPGAKDDFDSDASFFFEKAHVDALKGIFDKLTEYRGKQDTPQNKADTLAKLKQMAEITNAFGAVGAHANANWVALTKEKMQLLVKLEERQQDREVPNQGSKQVPKALLVKVVDQAAHNDAQALLNAMNGAGALPTPVRILAPDVKFTTARADAVNISLAGFDGVTAVGKAGAAYQMAELVTAAKAVLKSALGIA